ncbi:MAG: hypothetical protein AB1Z98_26525 [Nannocystaceae bacterium]
MDTISTTTHHDLQPGTLRLCFEAPRLEGTRVAAIVDAARRITTDGVRLADIDTRPAQVVLCGPTDELQRLHSAVQQGAAPTLGAGLQSMQLETARERELDGSLRVVRVLLVDGDPLRAEQTMDLLGRADMEVAVVGRILDAQALLASAATRFDALVLRHELPDGVGLDLLEAVPASDRRVSVLVIDDRPDADRAQAYRARGAFRYVEPPRGAMQTIGVVHATACDTLTWNHAGRGRKVIPEAPPRVHLDPSHAADRLQHVYGLTSIEREVAYCVLMGLRDCDIAKRLGRSERTAKRHVGCVLEKAEIQNRSSLWAVLVHEAGGDAPARSRQAESAATRTAPVGVASGSAPHSPASSTPAGRGPVGPGYTVPR